MATTDPIADFLNRIMNAQRARFDRVDIPASKVKGELARILREEGYIKSFKKIEDQYQGLIRVQLKYDQERSGAIAGVKRLSKPSRRLYVGYDEIPRVLSGLGIAIVSTSNGLMTDRRAREAKVGGELLCSVW